MTYNVLKVIKLTSTFVVFVTLISLLIIERVVDVIPNEIQQMRRRSRSDNLSPQISVVMDDKYTKTMSRKRSLSPTDRNLVLVIGSKNKTFNNFIQYILLLHPQVIYLGSLTAILDRWYLDSRAAIDINAALDWLYSCHSDALSVFIDYANELLVPPGVSFWCSTKRMRTRSVPSILDRFRLKGSTSKGLNSSVYCIPPPRKVFREMCLSHHIAIDVTSVAELATPHDVMRWERLKTIRLIGINCSLAGCSVTDIRKNSSDHVDNIFKETGQFVMCVDGTRRSQNYCMLELFNYLDIYLNLSFVNVIESFIASAV